MSDKVDRIENVKVYKLPYVIIPPLTDWNDEEDKYVAEIPLLPGCRAWGDTPDQAVEYLEGVAAAFIRSYRKRNEALPVGVEAMAIDVDAEPSQVVVAI